MTRDPFRFVVEQKLTAFGNRYRILGQDGALIGYSEQKRLAMKEDIRFFADEARTAEIFRLKARQVIDIGGRYDVTDGSGTPLGALTRNAKRSLLRTTWHVSGVDEREVLTLTERSTAIAAIRRVQNVLQVVPFVDGILDLIPIPFHFDAFAGEERVGGVTRITGFRDRYSVEMPAGLDPRLAMAIGVAMDALQSR